jgi:aldose sugar dehydrogenase
MYNLYPKIFPFLLNRALSIIFLFTIFILKIISIIHFTYTQQEMPTLTTSQGAPNVIEDPNLNVELVSDGLELPTSMAFLGPDDILVLEKEKGTFLAILL